MKILKSLIYRLSRSDWERLAIHHAFDGYSFNQVYLKEVDIVLKKGMGLHLLKGYENAKNLVSFGFDFYYQSGLLTCKFDSLEFEIQTAEELFILREIWLKGCYNYYLPGEHIVIDIGMNVGFASMYFATQKQPLKIYAFEPFRPTFDQALKNIKNNDLESVVVPYNLGWGKTTRLNLDYSTDHKGQMGIYGTKLVLEPVNHTSQIQVEINDPNEFISDITTRHKGVPVVLKIDCEGAEYEILDLIQEAFWQNIRIVMLEWHLKGPDPLISKLTEHGFKVLSFDEMNAKASMIYGVN